MLVLGLCVRLCAGNPPLKSGELLLKLADQGIHEKVSPEEWNRLVGRITRGIRSGQGADAICSAIEDIGKLLQAHFPIKPGDTDELDNLIIEK